MERVDELVNDVTSEDLLQRLSAATIVTTHKIFHGHNFCRNVHATGLRNIINL